jgi:hypothetical protein
LEVLARQLFLLQTGIDPDGESADELSGVAIIAIHSEDATLSPTKREITEILNSLFRIVSQDVIDPARILMRWRQLNCLWNALTPPESGLTQACPWQT